MFRRLALFLALGSLAACRDGVSPPPGPPSTPAPAESPAIREVEPNDDAEGAQELRVPATVEGAAGAKDADWYLLAPGASPRVVRLDAVGPGDLVLEVHAAGGRKRLLRAGAAPAGEAEVIDGLYQRDPVLVRVSAAAPQPVAYRLEVAARPYPRGAEAEPNGSIAEALSMPVGTAVTGTISFEEDEDVWRLDLPAAPPGDAGKRALQLELSAVAGLRPALAVVDADGAPVAERRARDTGGEVSFRNLALPPEARFPFYVVVKSAWTGKRRTAAPETPYRLLATLEPVAVDLEEEPNDEEARATPVTGLGRLGFLAPAGDVDWYSITVDRPVVARVAASGVDGVDLVLDAPDPAAGKDAVRARSNTGGVKDGELLPGLWLPAGTSYLRVSGGSRKVDGKWVRDYENPDQTYTLGVTLRNAFPGDEIEPNDAPERATPLRPGGRARGFLYPYRDVDVFRLDVGEEDEGTLVATIGALPRVQVALSLRGGEPVEGVLPEVASAVVDPATGEARLQAWVEPGAYLLEVRDAKGTGANPGDSYRLDVRVEVE